MFAFFFFFKVYLDICAPIVMDIGKFKKDVVISFMDKSIPKMLDLSKELKQMWKWNLE